MDWATIIVLLFAEISKCIENRDRDRVERSLNNPGWREAGALRRVLREAGLRGTALRLSVGQGMRELGAMSPLAVEDLCNEAMGQDDQTKGATR